MDTSRPSAIPSPAIDSPAPGQGWPARLPQARSAIAESDEWRYALDAVLEEIGDIAPDVAFLFVSAAFSEYFPDLVRHAWERCGAMLMLGCSATGVIGGGIEAEGQPAIAMLSLSLPGATLRPVRFTQDMIEQVAEPEAFRARISVPEPPGGWFVLADPFRFDASLLLERMNAAYPGVPMIGGLASPAEYHRRTWVFLNGESYGDGGIGLALGGGYDLLPVVSQGCEPVGESWTITGVSDRWIESISNRSALTMLAETLAVLPDEMQEEARRNLVIGLAADEYRDRFGRGDFLIRNVTGLDWERGAIAVGARPRVGQTIQFHLRDAATASLDLTLALLEAQTALEGRGAVAGLLYSCTGRGMTMFGVPDHDAAEVVKRLGDLPHAGIIAAGEIGPVGRRTFLHGFTASLGLILAPASGTMTISNAPSPRSAQG
jgi:small ligand-binding sensory domain FIST